MSTKKKKEIDLADALIRMVRQPGSVTLYQPVENPEDKYTINDLKKLAVNDGAVFMVEDDDDPEPEDAEPEQDAAEADPEASEEEPEPIRKTKTKEPKRIEIDDGKIRALFEAERPISWIAEDMDISEPTVRSHLKKMGLWPRKD